MNVSALEVCKKDLYTDRITLEATYPLAVVQKVLRVRDIHQRMIADPMISHRAIIAAICEAYGVSEQCAYSDLRIVKTLLPTLTESSRAFHRFRANEMLMETYRMAKEKGNLKVMADTANAYGRINGVEKEDEQENAYDNIPVQPFVPTSDPRVLGIDPIPNLREEINRLLHKYRAETVDIEDVTYEETDLEETRLFPAGETTTTDNDESGD